MNPFFGRDILEIPVPSQAYARTIAGDADAEAPFVLFDAVKTDRFDPVLNRSDGPSLSHRAAVNVVKVNSRRQPSRADLNAGLDRGRPLPCWVELFLAANQEDAAQVYANIASPPLRADLQLNLLSARLRRAVKSATDLGPARRPDAGVIRALPTADADQIYVLDLGQGSETDIDERSTKDRPGGPRTRSPGHIRLRWSGSVQATRYRGCGCPIDPTQ